MCEYRIRLTGYWNFKNNCSVNQLWFTALHFSWEIRSGFVQQTFKITAISSTLSLSSWRLLCDNCSQALIRSLSVSGQSLLKSALFRLEYNPVCSSSKISKTAHAWAFSSVGKRRSCFASFQPLATQHTSNRLNHNFALSSCNGSGDAIPLPGDVTTDSLSWVSAPV